MKERVFLFLVVVLGLASSLAAEPFRGFIPLVKGEEAWATRLALFNPHDGETTLSLTLHAAGTDVSRSVTLAAGERRDIEDAARSLFGVSTDGGLTVEASRFVSVRAFLSRPATTEGLPSQARIDALDESSAAATGERIEIPGFGSGVEGVTSTLVIFETAGFAADFELSVFDLSGRILVAESRAIAPHQTQRLAFDELALAAGRDYRVQIDVRRGKGRLVAQGTVISDASGDGIALRATEPFLDHPTEGRIAPAATARRTRRATRRVLLPGTLALEYFMAIPEADRDSFRQSRAVLEANGFTLAADASTISFPRAIPAGWSVTVGASSAYTDMTGTFTIELTANSPALAEVYSPQTPTALATFSVQQLGAGKPPIVIRLPFATPCDMNLAESAVANCRKPSGSGAISAMNTELPKPRGTNCEQLDGFVSSNFSPLLSYFGSTCQKRVVQGCCPDEGGWGIFSATICCVKNHRGRFCQELQPGDIVINGGNPNLIIDLGQSTPFNVHNNSCFGKSLEFKGPQGLGGTISGPGHRPGLVEHFDSTAVAAFNCGTGRTTTAYGMWVGDRTLNHTTPKCKAGVSGGEEDVYHYVADGIWKTIRFQLKKDFLYRFVGSNVTFSLGNSIRDGWRIAARDSGCTGDHVHGNHPCSGAADPAPSGCGHGMVVKVQ